ncbi:MAG UNVERIFIED_CONTAM: hypothetical protein LVQ98_07465 [Rickettsiaceae bacterium]
MYSIFENVSPDLTIMSFVDWLFVSSKLLGLCTKEIDNVLFTKLLTEKKSSLQVRKTTLQKRM